MAAATSVTGLVTWARSLVRSPGPGRRLSLAGPRPEAATIPVNRSLRDHGNGLGRGARGGGGGGSGGGSLVAGRDGGAAAEAAVAVAPAPALSVMWRSSLEQESAAGWETDETAAADSLEAEEGEQLGVDAGAAGEPERPEREEQPKAVGPTLTPTRRRATEEGDVRVVRRLPPALPQDSPRPVARALSHLVQARGRNRGYRRNADSVRPVTVDSSKARTSLDALKISLRQLRWKEVRPAGSGAGGTGGSSRGLAPGATSQVRSARPCPAPLQLQPYVCNPGLFELLVYMSVFSIGPGARSHLPVSYLMFI